MQDPHANAEPSDDRHQSQKQDADPPLEKKRQGNNGSEAVLGKTQAERNTRDYGGRRKTVHCAKQEQYCKAELSCPESCPEANAACHDQKEQNLMLRPYEIHPAKDQN